MGRIIAKRIRGMNWMAKVSLILIFTLICSTFMYQGWYKPKISEATRTSVGDGKIVYSATATTARTRNHTDSTNVFDVEGNAGAAAAANPAVVKIVASPTRNEYITGYVTTGGNLYIKRWDGTAWVDDLGPILVGGTGVNGRRFDLAYEQTSGDCILVYGNNAAIAATTGLVYRVWNGTSWAAAVNFGSARITGTATWIKMESRPGTDEIGMIVSDSASDLTAQIWTGAAWGSEPTAALSATLEIIAAAGDADCFDLAYESLTGDLLIVWADAVGANGTNGVRYATRTAAGTWTLNLTPATFIDDATNLDLCSDPTSDYILFGSIGNAGADYQHGAWSGTAWVNNTANVDGASLAPVAGSHTVSCGWLKNGSTVRGVIVYSDAAPAANGTVDFYSYEKGVAFTVGTDFAYTASGIVTERQIEVSMDPLMPDRLLAVFSDSASDLWAKRLVMDAVGAFTWSNADSGTALTATLTNITAQAFSYAYGRKDFTPPTAGTVTVSPDTGTYTSASPTITTVFTDADSAVTSCEYTTNGTFPGTAGVVSGSSPNYTCTANPIGLSGALTINMRATSGGGLGTATAISRTVDITGPTDGILTVALADPTSLFLSWTAATDGGSGLRTTNTYDVRFLTGATPPTCSTGTSIYTGIGLSYTHTGLTTGQQYSYRVCAYDNVNNPSAGATGSGAPKWPSTTTSCAGCHGYLSLFPDGTTRNTPAGRFVGSHNKHVITAGKACNVCHVVPAGDTSAYYGHRDSNIQMKIGSAVIDGGYYDRNNNSAYTDPTDYTFLQTNSPTLGPCRSVYCHSQGTGATSNTGDTRLWNAPITTINWGVTGSCSTCHGYPPSYGNGAPKANSHSKHQTQCSTCHNNTTTNSTSISIAGLANHASKLYNIAPGNGTTIGSYAYALGGGSCNNISCHSASGVNDTTRQWGGAALPTATFDCVLCHKATQAITIGPLAGTALRRAVSLEFTNTWSHKRSAAGAVTKYDCCVCHMEGVTATGVIDSTYHGDGYIQLRDPDTGATIKNVTFSGTPGSYTSGLIDVKFARFSRNLSATLESDANFLTIAAIQINQCLKCHDSDTSAGAGNGGAKSTLARVPTTGTALQPFGTAITGHVAPYSTNGVGNVVDVDISFATTNASYHPIRGKGNNSYAQGSGMMIAPWGMTTTPPSTTTWGYLISCWDCHALSTDAGTITKTVTAHGAATTLRGTIRVAGTTAATNLCLNCHKTAYSSTAAGQHGAGSAFAVGNNNMSSYMSACAYCHAYGPEGGANLATSTARPLRGEDAHGFNDRDPNTAGTQVWTTSAVRPYAFIRNILSVWSPAAAPEGTPTSTCTGLGTGTPCNNNMSNSAFTPGGTY